MATDKEIIKAINSEAVASDDLVSRDAWVRICKVRGRNLALVDEEAWQALCARRGYLLLRRPGFRSWWADEQPEFAG